MPRLSPLPNRTRTDRARLTREGIVAAAIEIADRDGIDAVSMRKLAQHFGVDPMSLYNHVRDKSELLDEMSDAVVSEIPSLVPGADWAATLRTLILSARGTLLRHPWAPQVIEAKGTPTPAGLRHVETVLGILHDGGFSLALAHHTLHVLGSRILGFSQDLYDDSPDDGPAQTAAAEQAAAAQAAAWAATHPRVAELAMAATHDGVLGNCDDDEEFEFSLDLILEGLQRRRVRD